MMNIVNLVDLTFRCSNRIPRVHDLTCWCSFIQQLYCAEVFHDWKGILHDRGLVTAVGDEGGFTQYPKELKMPETILAAIRKVGLEPGKDVYSLGFDCKLHLEFFQRYVYGSYNLLKVKKVLKTYPAEQVEYLAN